MVGDDEKLKALEESCKDVSSRVSNLERNAVESKNALLDLQRDVENLSKSLQKALQLLMPKVEELLNERKELSSVSAPGPPVATPAAATRELPPLLHAAEAGNAECVHKMLEAGENVRERDEHGNTALHLAAAGGHVRVIDDLIAFGADANVLGPRLRTPLHRAGEGGHTTAVRRLLSAGAKADAKDGDGCTTLVLAARVGRWEVVELMLDNGVSIDDTDKDGNSAMVHAAKSGEWGTVKLLCEKGASPKKYRGIENSPLLLAAEQGETRSVELLLNLEEGPTEAEQKNALSWVNGAAVVWAFEDAVPGTLRGVVGEWAMRQAAQEGRLRAMAALLDAGVDINARCSSTDCSALIAACSHGHDECVRELLERGACKDFKYVDGGTALYHASSRGYESIVRLLLEAGADATIKSSKGKTPLNVAKGEPVKLLLRNHLNY